MLFIPGLGNGNLMPLIESTIVNLFQSQIFPIVKGSFFSLSTASCFVGAYKIPQLPIISGGIVPCSLRNGP